MKVLDAVPAPAGDASTVGDALTIAEDVPCEACGYDLRGLRHDWRCPECGADVGTSLRAHRARLAPLPAPDPVWARAVAEGAALGLVALGLLLLLCFLPGQWFYLPRRDAPVSETPGRVALLCVASAAWVVAWYSTWKLTTPAPVGDQPAPRRRAAWAGRFATGYFLVPFVVGLLPTYEKNPPPFAPALLTLVVPPTCVLLLACIAGLFRRAGGGWAVLLAAVLAPLSAVALWLGGFVAFEGLYRRRFRVGSLDLLCDLPMPPFGVPAVSREIGLSLGEGPPRDPIGITLAAVTLAVAAVYLRLMLRYRRWCNVP